MQKAAFCNCLWEILVPKWRKSLNRQLHLRFVIAYITLYHGQSIPIVLQTLQKGINIKIYSYLRASMGLSLEARAAGATPKIIPIAVETPKASATLHQVTVVAIK